MGALNDFGWDTTPSIYCHDGTFSLVTKNNHYSVGSYCTDDTFCPVRLEAANGQPEEAYFISQLSPDFEIEWSYQATNTQNCQRDPANEIVCVDDGEHPRGFEWCVNSAAVDADGNVYVNSEDGYLYKLAQPDGPIFLANFQILLEKLVFFLDCLFVLRDGKGGEEGERK